MTTTTSRGDRAGPQVHGHAHQLVRAPLLATLDGHQAFDTYTCLEAFAARPPPLLLATEEFGGLPVHSG